MAMGRSPDPHVNHLEEQLKSQQKELKQLKKQGVPVMNVSFTAFGIVGPGMPIPAGVPVNFALKQAAVSEFFSRSPRTSKSLGNMKGEQAYRDYYDDIVADREKWMAFFDEKENFQHAEQTCGILGTLATIYRQRGVLDECRQVLDMELEVLIRYHRSSQGTSKEQVHCCDLLYFKYRNIRYNLLFQTKKYDGCVALFRDLAEYELKYNVSYEDQCFLFMIEQVLKRKATASSLKKLTDKDVMKMVVAPVELLGPGFISEAEDAKRVALNLCGNCGLSESALGQFKRCQQCRSVFYCGRECQKLDWKIHKVNCKQTAAED